MLAPKAEGRALLEDSVFASLTAHFWAVCLKEVAHPQETDDKRNTQCRRVPKRVGKVKILLMWRPAWQHGRCVALAPSQWNTEEESGAANHLHVPISGNPQA